MRCSAIATICAASKLAHSAHCRIDATFIQVECDDLPGPS